ncbi:MULTISPECIES: VWA domain-containing protein [Thermocrispum]|jgi:hypothetical protein|uniref:VWA domain-containing protein n=1 Tax=Thermocrispum agreste TaxID=37925 RepID=A0A2W4KNW6_9PSEU|nr:MULTISPECIES: VWA domain-containing protein [Thermocrispum]PZM90229.1 MAG: VWA domain-containing protein [Thermocrispum agreste]
MTTVGTPSTRSGRPDVLSGLVAFTRALSAAGLPVSMDRVTAYLEAVRSVDLAQPDALYWAGRLTLCGDPDDIALYDGVFRQWFLHQQPERPGGVRPRQPTIASLTPQPAGDGGDEGSPGDLHRVGASEAERLRHRDLGELTAEERAHLRELIALLRPRPPLRRAIRQRPARRGGLDTRRTVRAMLAAGGEPTVLLHRSRSVKPRRVVLLVDVSGSMEPYADALIRFAHALCCRIPGGVEVFTIGTRLTRITRQLRLRDPEHALAAAAKAVPDFAGGTRLGETLQAFLDRWGQRGTARSAIVVVFSDGWERGDPGLLGEQVARLKRLAFAVFWVNPHAGKDGYVPVQSGIAAALPHVDKLLAGHSLATLERLMQVMRDARRFG